MTDELKIYVCICEKCGYTKNFMGNPFQEMKQYFKRDIRRKSKVGSDFYVTCKDGCQRTDD